MNPCPTARFTDAIRSTRWDAGNVRIVVVAETFLPQMNGVVGSVLKVLEHLRACGHEALVIAPATEHDLAMEDHLHGAGATFLRSVALPSYPDVRVTFASAAQLESIMIGFRPDVVHLASPFVLGWQALRAAD